MPEKVMVNHDPKRKTRFYVDEGPECVAASVAQRYKVDGMDHEVWHPVSHNSRSKTNSKNNYGKVHGESLGVVNGIQSKQDVSLMHPVQGCGGP